MFGKKTLDFSEIHTQSLLAEILKAWSQAIYENSSTHFIRLDIRSKRSSGIDLIELSGLIWLKLHSSEKMKGIERQIRFKFLFPRDQVEPDSSNHGLFRIQKRLGAELSLLDTWDLTSCTISDFSYFAKPNDCLGDMTWRIENISISGYDMIRGLRSMVA